MRKIELLVPASSLEVLKIAVIFGADAVYIGGEAFGLRAKAKNFSHEDMKEGIAFAHEHGVKVYVTVNILAHNYDLPGVREYLTELKELKPDALIIADPGIYMYAKEICPEIERHISTQANNTNYETYRFWYNLGAKRVVTARELSLAEIKEIREHIPEDMEIETFIHGAMCISYSGRCLLSNYLTDRHSNKGECSQPCRWEYSLMERTRHGEYFPVEETASGTYIMNSKDMCMIEHIPELIEAGVSSFKIEGRAKTEYYTAVVTNAYRSAVDAYLAAPSNDFKPAQWMVDEVYKISHRDYCTGFFFGSPRDDAQIYYKGGYVRSWEVAAIAVKSENGTLTVSQRNRFFEGDELEIMNRGKEPTVITVRNLRNSLGESVDNAPNPMAEFTFDCDADVPAGAFIRRSTDEK